MNIVNDVDITKPILDMASNSRQWRRVSQRKEIMMFKFSGITNKLGAVSQKRSLAAFHETEIAASNQSEKSAKFKHHKVSVHDQL